jgi:hypothetical protein
MLSLRDKASRAERSYPFGMYRAQVHREIVEGAWGILLAAPIISSCASVQNLFWDSGDAPRRNVRMKLRTEAREDHEELF